MLDDSLEFPFEWNSTRRHGIDAMGTLPCELVSEAHFWTSQSDWLNIWTLWGSVAHHRVHKWMPEMCVNSFFVFRSCMFVCSVSENFGQEFSLWTWLEKLQKVCYSVPQLYYSSWFTPHVRVWVRSMRGQSSRWLTVSTAIASTPASSNPVLEGRGPSSCISWLGSRCWRLWPWGSQAVSAKAVFEMDENVLFLVLFTDSEDPILDLEARSANQNKGLMLSESDLVSGRATSSVWPNKNWVGPMRGNWSCIQNWITTSSLPQVSIASLPPFSILKVPFATDVDSTPESCVLQGWSKLELQSTPVFCACTQTFGQALS